ncbi:MAG: porin, partial [Gemmataceae bacterium]|nr:porin [Gemmataceae bacterium]
QPPAGPAAPGGPPSAFDPEPGTLGPAPAPADRNVDPVGRLFPQDGRLRVRGWLDGGGIYNTANPNSRFNGPYNAVDRNQEPMFNQAYGVFEYVLPTDGSAGLGARLDLLYGNDFLLAQSPGFEVGPAGQPKWNGTYYGLALPQAYVQAGTEALSVKLGHFYTVVGYEGVPADGNFFYTHSYSYMFAGPFTQWGGLLTAKPSDRWQVDAGLVNGWNALDGVFDAANFLGRVKYTPESRQWWASAAVITGDQPNNVAGLPGIPSDPSNRTRYSAILGLTPGGPGGPWEYVFHYFQGFQANGTAAGTTALWYGIDQYLFCRVSDKLRLGARFEWMRDEDGTRVGLNRAPNPNKPPLPGNYFSLTTGFNYNPCPNVTIRPEIRWDFTSDTVGNPFNDGRSQQQLLLGADLIVRF